jgi:predicted phosphodiesterase
MNFSRRGFLGLAAGAAAPGFSFGVLADLQYADKEAANRRDYRGSLAKLDSAAQWFARERLKFVIQLGDLVDGGLDNLDRVLARWNRLRAPRRHVIGNHDGEIDRATLLKRLKLERGYYQFRAPGWRFIVLDGMDWSVSEGARLLAELREKKEPNAQTWNGAIGDAQRGWLQRTLQHAAAAGERAILFCHFPVLPEACRREHLLWNWREILDLIESVPAATAWFSGHDHLGGYAARAGIHHVTVPGVVENNIGDAARVVDVFRDRLVIRGQGGKALTAKF